MINGRQHMQCGYAGKGMILVPGRRGWGGTRFHHATQNGVQFQTYEFCIWNFPLTHGVQFKTHELFLEFSIYHFLTEVDHR